MVSSDVRSIICLPNKFSKKEMTESLPISFFKNLLNIIIYQIQQFGKKETLCEKQKIVERETINNKIINKRFVKKFKKIRDTSTERREREKQSNNTINSIKTHQIK